MTEIVLIVVGSIVLAGFHVVTPALVRLPERYQGALASVTGGAGLAYVSLYLLFELAREGAENIHALVPMGPDPLETLFMLLLCALTATYIIHMQLQKTTDLQDDHHGYVALFFTYNILVGAGLVEEARWGAVNLATYVLALGIHMLSNDLYLAHLCPRIHTRRWRAVLASGPLVGAAMALALAVPVGILYMLLAFIAGSTLINALRFELPGLQSFRPLAFLVGVAGYATLIFATWRF